MNTWAAFAMGEANRGKEIMVFDWDKAARLIRERKPECASAGLRSDWEYTGGTIYEDGKPVMDDYTYLASTWAVPELDMDGDIVECFRMEHEVPGWGSKTKWPKSALDILSAEEMEMLEGERIAEFIKAHPDKDKPYHNQDLFDWHHKLTGSCMAGRNAFVKDRGLTMDGETTVTDFIKLTENAYGGSIIRNLLKAYDNEH